MIVIFILGCFVAAFLVYLKPPSSWLDGPSNKDMLGDEKTITILVWLWPFGKAYETNICSSAFNIEGCFVTANRNFYNKSDGVVMHHRDIARDLSNLPKLQRPPFQKWIWMNLESPSNSGKLPGINNLFNLTLNYRQDSDIQIPYGSIEIAETVEDFVPPSKNKLVCWIVSNWSPRHVRSKYYNELKKHIKVDVYGRAFGKYIAKKDYNSIMASCKFYLFLLGGTKSSTALICNPQSVEADDLNGEFFLSTVTSCLLSMRDCCKVMENADNSPCSSTFLQE
uniref:Fucosyltransferase n=1 Tax=Fundulus heteroclitus TaxID=8078 RepID=A0A3Q2P8M4_FUNHE